MDTTEALTVRIKVYDEDGTLLHKQTSPGETTATGFRILEPINIRRRESPDEALIRFNHRDSAAHA